MKSNRKNRTLPSLDDVLELASARATTNSSNQQPGFAEVCTTLAAEVASSMRNRLAWGELQRASLAREH